MTRIEIARGNGFHLVSYGNGTAYDLSLDGEADSVFVQGDDATQFREEWEALEAAKPHTHTSALLAEMWERYSHG